jgi:hypothetical protein
MIVFVCEWTRNSKPDMLVCFAGQCCAPWAHQWSGMRNCRLPVFLASASPHNSKLVSAPSSTTSPRNWGPQLRPAASLCLPCRLPPPRRGSLVSSSGSLFPLLRVVGYYKLHHSSKLCVFHFWLASRSRWIIYIFHDGLKTLIINFNSNEFQGFWKPRSLCIFVWSVYVLCIMIMEHSIYLVYVLLAYYVWKLVELCLVVLSYLKQVVLLDDAYKLVSPYYFLLWYIHLWPKLQSLICFETMDGVCKH